MLSLWGRKFLKFTKSQIHKITKLFLYDYEYDSYDDYEIEDDDDDDDFLAFVKNNRTVKQMLQSQ